MSRIACACSARELELLDQAGAGAAPGSVEERISLITASMFDERDQQALEDVRAALGALAARPWCAG